MRDYWLTQFFLQAIGWFFIGVFAVAVLLAAWLPKRGVAKLVAVALVFAAAAIPVYNEYREYQRAQAASAAFKLRLRTAEALFAQRCTQAGEKIHRTVEGVRGIYLVNLRPENDGRTGEKHDPAGDASTGLGYVSTFFSGVDLRIASGLTDRNRIGAYAFVQAPSKDGGVIQYTDDRTDVQTQSLDPQRMASASVGRRTARYGVEWTNISTNEDRQLWIAGTRTRVIDLDTQEVLAERIGYVMDKGQGSTLGERDPWQSAQYNACPAFPKVQDVHPTTFGLTRNFVQKVLKP